MADFHDARERWNARFASADGFLFGRDPNRWLAASAGWLAPASRVLSVADGEGRNGVWLARQGHRVTAFDLSDVGVGRAAALAAEQGVELELKAADVAQWKWEPDAYDAVAAIFIQFAGPDLRARIFEGIGATLRPGGVLILEGYGPRQLVYRTGGPGVAENLYTMPMLLEAFAGWDILASRDADLELEEGAGHAGRSHVISLVLRKPAEG